VIYDYCKDTERFPALPVECKLSPWDWWASDELIVILQHHIFFLFPFCLFLGYHFEMGINHNVFFCQLFYFTIAHLFNLFNYLYSIQI
jgi:hypothetical protein